MAKLKNPASLIIAGPGAGKTHNMVKEITENLTHLSASKYMVVITYTNSATENIKSRLSKKINIPPNLFIGTIHAFLNKFVIIPYSSLHDSSLSKEKVFIQCGTSDIFLHHQKLQGRKYDFKAAAAIKSKISKTLNQKGYISFDQTITLSESCLSNPKIARIIANRIQYLFIDEFQDTSIKMHSIIENIRKNGPCKIYCVGDPEQYIQSYSSTIKDFKNITILKASKSSNYRITLNTDNHRSSEEIVDFLNHFNSKDYNGQVFQQVSKVGKSGIKVKFLIQHSDVKRMLPVFDKICTQKKIKVHDRCIVAKKDNTVAKISAALNNNVAIPNSTSYTSPLKVAIDTLLSVLDMNQNQFFNHYKADIYILRKRAISIIRAINNGTITNANSFLSYVTNHFGYATKNTIPINIDKLKALISNPSNISTLAVSNIHKIKGLESEAILAVARTEAELLLWIETDRIQREFYRKGENNDYPRLGYVAFSRAKKILCISCIEKVSQQTIGKLTSLGVKVI